MQPREFGVAETIMRQHDAGDEIFFIERGEVSVGLTTGRKRNRLAVLTSGMVFGELALVERNVRRTADVYAKTAVRCRVLPASLLEAQTGALADAVRHKLLRNVNLLLLEHLRRDHLQIRMLV